jgi:hypothetical protein
MVLSQRTFRGAAVCGVLALHGAEVVDAAASEQQYGLPVVFAIGAVR